MMRTTILALAMRRAFDSAKDGPRVAGVARITKDYRQKKKRAEYVALNGFMDADSETFEQILLVTPDGRFWECFDPAPTLTLAEREIVYGEGVLASIRE
jgi:hypothetical protein